MGIFRKCYRLDQLTEEERWAVRKVLESETRGCRDPSRLKMAQERLEHFEKDRMNKRDIQLTYAAVSGMLDAVKRAEPPQDDAKREKWEYLAAALTGAKEKLYDLAIPFDLLMR